MDKITKKKIFEIVEENISDIMKLLTTSDLINEDKMLNFIKKYHCNMFYNNLKTIMRNTQSIKNLYYYNIINNITKKFNISEEKLNYLLRDVEFQHILSNEFDKLVQDYYYKLFLYIQEDYKIYSLGDSLEKLNYLWNINFKDDKKKQILTIPFSGSTYKKENGEIIFDEEKYQKIQEEYNNLKENNKNFNEMIDDIKQGKNVLLTDYGAYGKALATIMYMLYTQEELLPENMSNLKFLIIIADGGRDYETVEQKTEIIYNYLSLFNKEPFDESPLNRFFGNLTNMDYIIGYYPRVLSNSDDDNYKSRCIAKYDVDKWEDVPSYVWMDENNRPNYFMCNLSRLIILQQISHNLSEFCRKYDIDMSICHCGK